MYLGDALEQAALCLVGRVADLRQDQHDEVIPGARGLEQAVEVGVCDLIVGVRVQHLPEHVDRSGLVAKRVLVELRKPELQRSPVPIGGQVGAAFEQGAKRFESVVVLIERFERVHRDRVVFVQVEGGLVGPNRSPWVVEVVSVDLADRLGHRRSVVLGDDFQLPLQQPDNLVPSRLRPADVTQSPEGARVVPVDRDQLLVALRRHLGLGKLLMRQLGGLAQKRDSLIGVRLDVRPSAEPTHQIRGSLLCPNQRDALRVRLERLRV